MGNSNYCKSGAISDSGHKYWIECRIVILFCDAEIKWINVRQLETKHRHLDCLDFIQIEFCVKSSVSKFSAEGDVLDPQSALKTDFIYNVNI